MNGNDSISISSDQPVHWADMQDDLGNVVSNATVTGQLKDSTGSVLSSFSLPCVDAPTGLYRGIIPHSVTSGLTEFAFYYIELTATSGGVQEFRRLKRRASYRGEE